MIRMWEGSLCSPVLCHAHRPRNSAGARLLEGYEESYTGITHLDIRSLATCLYPAACNCFVCMLMSLTSPILDACCDQRGTNQENGDASHLQSAQCHNALGLDGFRTS